MGEAVPSSSTKSGQRAASPHGTQLTSCTPKLARVYYCMGGWMAASSGIWQTSLAFHLLSCLRLWQKVTPPHTHTKKQQIEVGWAMAVVTSRTGMFTVGHMRFLLRPRGVGRAGT